MGVTTAISWCHHTWSPWRGCAKISPGCANCYAEKLSHRNPEVLGEWGPHGKRSINRDWKQLYRWNLQAAKEGLAKRVFPSLCDPFEDRDDLKPWREQFFAAIRGTPWLQYLILTKRPENVIDMMDDMCWPESGCPMFGPDDSLWSNVWLGVSVEDQEYADRRIPSLLEIPATIRWISYEPAIGPVDWSEWLFCEHCRNDDQAGQGAYLTPLENACGGPWFRECYCSRINWIVCGGESGGDRRPFEVEWASRTAKQCKNAKVPFYMKQDAASKSEQQGRIPEDLWRIKQFPGDKLPKP